ncbi:putative UPF0160 protein MYG1 [Triplophysa rosa]|uniref:UPF0160 protein MYG1 n=1 Tax=Triplophysa rosa TaxID=992332 RepID=A0A9W7WD25_TRIRA|nr:putative UPF0160 protein MYG1 [Triplophysa rosa]
MNVIRGRITRVFSNKVHFMKMSEEAHKARVRIGTHNGTFHCDEVLACFLLRQLPEYKAILGDWGWARVRAVFLLFCPWLIRIFSSFKILIVPLLYFFNRSFVESFNSLCSEKPWVTKLSSAGLIYLHFGRRVLAELTQLKQEDRQLEALYDKVTAVSESNDIRHSSCVVFQMYENFVEEVDAVDNGISQCDGEARYSITTTLSARVGHLNPHWNSKNQDTEEGFHKAIALVGAEFQDRLSYFMNAWVPARDIVQQAVQSRYQVDPSGVIVLLAQGGCPWKEHLFALEKEMKLDVPIKFLLYPDQNGHWRVQCVPAGPNTFQNRFCCPTFNLPFCHSESSRGNTLHSGAEGFIIITIIIITPNECSQQPENLTVSARISECLADISLWMNDHHLQLSLTKTELLVIPADTKSHHNFSIQLGSSTITSSRTARNLGVVIDNQLNFTDHVASTTRSCKFILYNIRKIRPFLSEYATQVLVQALVLSRLDYCNALLAGLPACTTKPLQMIQNAVARVVFNEPKRAHVTPLFTKLHWLPIVARIKFKTLLLAYKTITGLAPHYLHSLMQPDPYTLQTNNVLWCHPKKRLLQEMTLEEHRELSTILLERQPGVVFDAQAWCPTFFLEYQEYHGVHVVTVGKCLQTWRGNVVARSQLTV